MGRFREPPDPVFHALNASLSYDRRLGSYDVRQSQAHVAMLAEAGILTAEDAKQLHAGLDAVAAELEHGSFEFQAADEDIHMAIERRLTEIAGPVGGKVHTARSRNDQVATDMALFVRRPVHRGQAAIARPDGHARRPRRAPRRLADARDTPTCSARSPSTCRTTCSPTSGCSAATSSGSRMPLARPRSCRSARARWQASTGTLAASPSPARWDFDGVVENSLDAVSNRDFVLDYLSAAAICAMHLSRLGAEIVLWSSEEFGFLELGDSFTSGSSLMPQKKNPDAAELLRAKAPRIAAHLNALLGVMHALPLAYNKDMQEDKEQLFDTVDTLNLCLEAATGMLRTAQFDRERLAGAAADEFLAATDVADLLVRRGVPFRESHAIVGGLVRHALEQHKQLSELTREEIGGFSEQLDDEYYTVVSDGSGLESKVSEGGTASSRVSEQLTRARAILGGVTP